MSQHPQKPWFLGENLPNRWPRPTLSQHFNFPARTNTLPQFLVFRGNILAILLLPMLRAWHTRLYWFYHGTRASTSRFNKAHAYLSVLGFLFRATTSTSSHRAVITGSNQPSTSTPILAALLITGTRFALLSCSFSCRAVDNILRVIPYNCYFFCW